ncbi:MAG: biotin/lipoyl-binding protein [Oscillospiraceae bacterium]|nr:biotin/lipoyl-binding protein [Oscillospiraceae bacterium]
MNETPKNREWVKNAAIVFLAVLLVLTFFSNTIMNRSLPEVATQDVTDGAIVSKVRGSGTVTANGNNQVKMEKTRIIRAVLVKAGQEVKAGDVLFTLGEGSSEEIEALEEKIRNLQNSYNRTAVSGQVYTNYSYDERSIDNKLQAWENAMDKLAYYESKVAQAAADTIELEQAEKRLALAKILKDEAEASYNDQLADKEANLERVKADAEAETQRQIDDTEGKISAAEAEQAEYVDYSVLTTELSEIVEDLNNIKSEISSNDAEKEANTATIASSSADWNYYTNEVNRLDREIAELIVKRDAEQDPVKKQEIQDEIDAKQSEKDNDNAIITADKAIIDNLTERNTYLDTIRPGLVSNETQKEAEKANKESEISGKYPIPPTDQSELIDTLEARLLELLSEGASKELIDEAIEALNAVSGETYTEAKAKYEAAVLERDNLLEKTDPMLNYEYQQALNACKSAEDAYYAAIASLDQKQASDWRSQAATGVDLNATMQELDVAKKKLAELTGTDGENITAKVAGTVTSVECNAGDKKMKDDVLCTIEVPDQGYTLSFTATNEQASRLRIGDQATVSNFYWGNEVTATLSSIKTDPKNPQNNKLLTFDLEGNVTSGSQLTISVGSKSANYDLIIPSSAIRSDSNGSFVLKVEAKNSPLGNRYIAKRVPVEVLASDDNNSAVTAELQYGDYVITTSSAPIKNGSMVRLANAS